MKISGIHKGEPIYVIGSGPSLTPEIARELQDSELTTIGVNKIYQLMIPRYHLHCDYHVDINGKRFSDRHHHELEATIYHGSTLIAPVDDHLRPTTDLPHYPYYSDWEVGFRADFDDNGILRLGHSSTSIYHALQVAVIMGGNPIILIGVDFYFDLDTEGVGKLHSYNYENKAILGATKIRPEEIDAQNKRLEKFERDLKLKALPEIEKRGVLVVNNSPKSKLSVFPKI